LEIVKAFRSQFYVPDATEYEQELSSPISSKSFMDFLKAKAASYGRVAGFDFGEGFVVNRTPGVEDLFQLT
ncbi:MAG: bacillithiol biosynthesis deacetylase BshB1, partial [Phaeodactylibacter sp.]|nr:bacillithiol biosynthesis deacetylase BshB1 [Phaeodactylibacter sp.]